MRAQDERYLKRVRAEQSHLERMKQYDELIRPTMVDLHTFLKQQQLGETTRKSSDHLSARQLEALARWKLGLDAP